LEEQLLFDFFHFDKKSLKIPKG